MSEILGLLVTGVGVVLTYCLVFALAGKPETVLKEQAWELECHARGGMFIPRTTICVKREIVLQPKQKQDMLFENKNAMREE